MRSANIVTLGAVGLGEIAVSDKASPFAGDLRSRDYTWQAAWSVDLS